MFGFFFRNPTPEQFARMFVRAARKAGFWDAEVRWPEFAVYFGWQRFYLGICHHYYCIRSWRKKSLVLKAALDAMKRAARDFKITPSAITGDPEAYETVYGFFPPYGDVVFRNPTVYREWIIPEILSPDREGRWHAIMSNGLHCGATPIPDQLEEMPEWKDFMKDSGPGVVLRRYRCDSWEPGTSGYVLMRRKKVIAALMTSIWNAAGS